MNDDTTIKIAKAAGDFTEDVTGSKVLERFVILIILGWGFICPGCCIAFLLSLLAEV